MLKKWMIITAAALVVVLCAAAFVLERFIENARPRLVKALEERFDSDVQISKIDVSLLPSFKASGEGIVLKHKRRTDIPPLIQVKRFDAGTNLFSLLAGHIRSVRLEGLQITIPPRKKEGEKEDKKDRKPADKSRYVVDELIANGTTLTMMSKKPGGDPLVFDIHQLRMRKVSLYRPMDFDPRLRNAKPPGEIHSKGKFGPWERDEPGLTPVSGVYDFRDADLSVFKGISGKLSSEGKYQGKLERLEVQGYTDVPDFAVRVSGHPVHLRTDFKATVDGTSGDTLLHPVEAKFEKSTVIANGGVTGTPGRKGKTVALDVNVSDGRLEDMLRLGVKSLPAPMQGDMEYQVKLMLPPGDRDVVDKLKLDGTFNVQSGRFTSLNVRQKVESLSRRAKGDPEGEETKGSAVSNLKGNFNMGDGVIGLKNLTFQIPGARVNLDGTFTLESQALDFRGTVETEAKVSEMVTGVKSVLLKAVDPIFSRKKKGAVIPIKIGGTQKEPSFGLATGGGRKR